MAAHGEVSFSGQTIIKISATPLHTSSPDSSSGRLPLNVFAAPHGPHGNLGVQGPLDFSERLSRGFGHKVKAKIL